MSGDLLAVLQRIRAPSPDRPDPAARCEMCDAEIGDDHAHVVDVDERALKCTCRPCSFLFWSGGAAGGRLRTVPDRHLSVPAFRLNPGDWDALQIPVSVAFFLRSSRTGATTAFYPSPAGATESLLDTEAWARVVAENPPLADVEADVEAVLLRVTPSRAEAFIVPVDGCYEMVGNLRRLWRGFDGGTEAREYTDSFFSRLRARSTPPTESVS